MKSFYQEKGYQFLIKLSIQNIFNFTKKIINLFCMQDAFSKYFTIFSPFLKNILTQFE